MWAALSKDLPCNSLSVPSGSLLCDSADEKGCIVKAFLHLWENTNKNGHACCQMRPWLQEMLENRIERQGKSFGEHMPPLSSSACPVCCLNGTS